MEGNFATIKAFFVSKDLNLAGKWSSPGGERKIFNDSTLGITLRWSGLTRGRLTIVNDTEQNLLANALSCLHRKFNTDPNSTAASEGLAINVGDGDFIVSQAGGLQSGPSVIHDTSINVDSEVRGVKPNTIASGDAVFVGRNSFVNSVNRVIQRDLDILKLDVSILETRLPLAISQNESNIDSVRLKQKDLEFVVWQQQQEICKLNEENQLFKLKLELIEKQLFKLIKNNQVNNTDDPKLPEHAFITPSVTSPSDSEQFVNPHVNSNTINRHLAGKVIPSVKNIAPSIDGPSERSNQHNADEAQARAPFHNNINVTSEAVPQMSNAPSTIESQLDDYPLNHQHVLKAKQSLNSKQLSGTQIEQLSFDEQINEYKQKHKRSSHNQRKKIFFKQKIYHPRSRSHVNRKPKSSSNHKNAMNPGVCFDIHSERRHNFHITTSKRRPPDWNNYLKLVSQLTSTSPARKILN